MSEHFDTDVNFHKQQLENPVAHLISSYPSDARNGQFIYHLGIGYLCYCINDTIDTTSPLAWRCCGSFTDPSGIRDVNCPEATEVNDAVYVSGSNEVRPARGNVIGTAQVFGFVRSKESATKCTVITSGLLDGFSGLIEGKIYFLSTQFDGGITDDVPTGNVVLIRVGKAFTSTQLHIRIDDSIIVRNTN